MSSHDPIVDRRAFLLASAAGAATVLGGASSASAFAGRPGPVARSSRPAEPWGRLEPLADGVWALVSTPLADHPDARRTLCNGGIIAGRDGALVVEAFGTPESRRGWRTRRSVSRACVPRTWS